MKSIVLIVLSTLISIGSASAAVYNVLTSTDTSRTVERIDGLTTTRVTTEATVLTAEHFTATVSQSVGDHVSITATVDLTSTTRVISGQVEQIPYSMTATRQNASTIWSVTWTFGQYTFLETYDTSAPPSSPSSGRIAFRSTVEQSAAWPTLVAAADFVSEIPSGVDGDAVLGIAVIGANGPSAAPNVAMGDPIGGYLDCLKSACGTCGGCWGGSGPCKYCGGESFWERRVIGACYSLDATLCLLELPIESILGGHGGLTPHF